jgi:hypothetical protein
MVAAIPSDVNLYEYAEQALLFLLMLGGAALILGNAVVGGSSVSSTSSRSRKHTPLVDSLDAGEANGQPAVAKVPLLRQATGGKRQRRASTRRRGRPIGVVVLADEPAKAESGLVIDRSKGGLCLSLPRPVSVGTTLQVRACQAPEGTPWIGVRVRHCVERGDRWELGCQFLEELPWSVLLLFG